MIIEVVYLIRPPNSDQLPPELPQVLCSPNLVNPIAKLVCPPHAHPRAEYRTPTPSLLSAGRVFILAYIHRCKLFEQRSVQVFGEHVTVIFSPTIHLTTTMPSSFNSRKRHCLMSTWLIYPPTLQLFTISTAP